MTDAVSDDDGDDDSAIDDHAVATDVAHRAGEMLVDLINSPDLDRRWGGLEYEGDARAHRFIMAELRRFRPGDAILSEEGADDRSRLDADRVWIVDPLDGSSDYGYSPHWSVHVALVVDGSPVAGAVAVPGWETTWSTDPAPDPVPAHVDDGAAPRIVVSRSRSRFDGMRLQDQLGADIYTVGSAGVKAMAVVRGEVDAYVHGGGLYEWDSCAPVAVARAAGLVCCRLDGSPLDFNKPDPWSPGLVISRPGLVDDICAVMGDRQP
ncbi:MAG: 3'(2'),5'-bisphosphate nucleotidase CysQ [Actinomycetota bacterium]